MNAKQLAEQLTGREYPFRVSNEEKVLAKDCGLVIAYGDSDDLLEFRGAIDDEIGAYDGTTVYVDETGIAAPLEACSDGYRCPHFIKLYEYAKKHAARLDAEWCAPNSPPWTIRTDIPHSTFDIMEDGEVQSRGIVFELKDAKGADQ